MDRPLTWSNDRGDDWSIDPRSRRLTTESLLAVALLPAGIAFLADLMGSIEAATVASDGYAGWQDEIDGAPKATVAQTDTCVLSTTFRTPISLTAL